MTGKILCSVFGFRVTDIVPPFCREELGKRWDLTVAPTALDFLFLFRYLSSFSLIEDLFLVFQAHVLPCPGSDSMLLIVDHRLLGTFFCIDFLPLF